MNYPDPRKLADVLWDLLRQRSIPCDSALIDAVVEARPDGLPFNGPARRNWFLVGLLKLSTANTADGQCTSLGLARWAEHGYQHVSMPATYAAALLATAIQDSILPKVTSPFPAFVIDVPEELLPVDNSEGPDFVTRVVVFRHEHRLHPEGAWAYVAWTKRTLQLWRFGVSVADLLPPTLTAPGASENAEHLASFPVEITDLDRRTKALLGRLIVNTCLAMTDPANVRTKGNVHRVGRRLELDLREEVRAYGLGLTRRSPEVGGWVSSHWKMQPYGPGSALRKWIFVEPYWRGPDVVSPITTDKRARRAEG